MSNREEKLKELERIESTLKEFDGARQKLREDLGLAENADIAVKHRAEDEDAMIFDRLSGPEMLDLFQNHPERFEQLVEAKRRAGERTLFRTGVP